MSIDGMLLGASDTTDFIKIESIFNFKIGYERHGPGFANVSVYYWNTTYL